MVILFLLNGYLIVQLKKTNPEEYESAGKPRVFWLKYRTFVFMHYVLTGKYKNIRDKNLVTLFNISRVLNVILVAGIIFFLITISVTD